MRKIISSILLFSISFALLAREKPVPAFPKFVDGGAWDSPHVQGIAVDKERGEIYWSFTTMLVKTDYSGKVLGTVTGLLGHLGCLAFNEEDGKVYGSIEYKDDVIGKGILAMKNSDKSFKNAFFVAVFDGSRIVREGMDSAEEGIMSTICLPTVLEDYEGSSGYRDHVYACSGIDGVSFGPAFGRRRGRNMLTVAYGIYGDISRADNDYQVILQYDMDTVARYARPFIQDNPVISGPAAPQGKYFVYTGNTNYGVQNLCYDPDMKCWLMFVYPGSKESFPNGSLYVADGRKTPSLKTLKGSPSAEKGLVVPLLRKGSLDAKSGVRWWKSKYGTTGAACLGNGNFLMTRSFRKGNLSAAEAYLFRWTGKSPEPLERVL